MSARSYDEVTEYEIIPNHLLEHKMESMLVKANVHIVYSPRKVVEGDGWYHCRLR